MLSYLTNDRKSKDSASYMQPAEELPPSETEGLGQLNVKGATFTNVPEPIGNYVPRASLENELEGLLKDSERHPIVTLTGRGGIGKTSSALQVVTRLIESEGVSIRSSSMVQFPRCRPVIFRAEGSPTPWSVYSRFCSGICEAPEPGRNECQRVFQTGLPS